MIPVVVFLAGGVILIGGAAYEWYEHRKGYLSPARKTIFDAAMASLTDPAQLNALAATFDRYGLPDEAAALRQKAANLTLPAAQKSAYQQAVADALATTSAADAPQVQNLANQLRNQGATQAATLLDQQAQDLINGQGAFASDGRGTTAPDPVFTPTPDGGAADVVSGGVTTGGVEAPAGTPAPTPIVGGGNTGDSGAEGGGNGDEGGGDPNLAGDPVAFGRNRHPNPHRAKEIG